MSATRTRQNFWSALPPLLLCVTVASSQESNQGPASIAELRATQHPLSKVGLAIGDRIPGFRALDQNGTPRDFESIRGPKGAVLYFYRSADWCIYCRTQLEESEASRETLRKNGLGLAGISFDSREILKRFADEKGIHFPLLSDPESKLIRDLQVLDDTLLPGSPGYGVPYHGSYIIDEHGIVVAKRFDAESTLNHQSGVAVSRLFGSPLNTHEKAVKHDHLKLSYYASKNSVSPGDEIELTIDVTLNDGIHVYAPPGGPYLPIDWQLTPQPGATILPVVFPPAQARPVNNAADDTASAYTGNFRLTRRVAVSPSGIAELDSQGNISLKGTFKFQACDEKICYAPITIPLDWKLGQSKPGN